MRFSRRRLPGKFPVLIGQDDFGTFYEYAEEKEEHMNIQTWAASWKKAIRKDKHYSYPDRVSFQIDVYGIDRETALVLEQSLLNAVEQFVDEGVEVPAYEGFAEQAPGPLRPEEIQRIQRLVRRSVGELGPTDMMFLGDAAARLAEQSCPGSMGYPYTKTAKEDGQP